MTSKRDVPIDVTSRHGHVSSKMIDYAIQKAERLPRFNGQISRIEIVVDGPHDAPTVEMLVHLDRAGSVVAKERSDHFHSAIDGLVDKIERQLVKVKQKHRKHRGEATKDLPVRDSPDDEETYDDIVRRNLDG